MRIDHLQQSREGLGVTVVRGGGEEQAVLALLGQLSHRGGPLGVHGVAATPTGRRRSRWCHVVGLVHDEDVEGVAASRGRSARLGQDIAQQTLSAHARQPGHRHDDPRVEAEGIRRQPRGTADLGELLGVDEAELLPHLLLPLQAQTRRADDDDRAGAVAQEELLDDQARLDRLAQADVVGQEEVRARRLQGTAQRLELVGLQARPGTEGGLVLTRIRRGDRAPADGIDECADRVRVVERGGADRLGQALVRQDGVPVLQFPDDVELLPHAVLLQGLEGDDVLDSWTGVIRSAARQTLLDDVSDRPGGAADLDHLPGLRESWHHDGCPSSGRRWRHKVVPPCCCAAGARHSAPGYSEDREFPGCLRSRPEPQRKSSTSALLVAAWLVVARSARS